MHTKCVKDLVCFLWVCVVDATAAEGLTVTFEETVGLPRYIQQARVFVSWVPPSGEWWNPEFQEYV